MRILGKVSLWTWAAIILLPIAFELPRYLIRHGHAPPVGTYIAVMGALAAAVTLRKDPPLIEKAAWIFLISLLMAAEVQNLYSADAEQAAKFDAIASKLEVTKQGIDKSIATLGTIVNNLDKVSKGIKETINTETGADTFCYVDFGISPSYWLDGKPSQELRIRPALVRIGRYPLRDIEITIIDDGRASMLENQLLEAERQRGGPTSSDLLSNMSVVDSQSTTKLPTESLDVPVKGLPSMPAIEGDDQEFTVDIRTFNIQRMLERFSMRKVNGHWTRAILLERHQRGKPDWFKVDPDFPRRDGHLDVHWPMTAGKREPWDH